MLKIVKICLVLSVAVWGLVGAIHNVMDWGGTLGAVKATTSMSTFEQGSESWQATESMVLVWIGALFIVFAKLLTAILCLFGAAQMWQTRFETGQFNQAKTKALAGCGIALLMLFFGFVVVAESWFELWRSEAMRGPVLDSALRYAALIALIALFIANKDE